MVIWASGSLPPLVLDGIIPSPLRLGSNFESLPATAQRARSSCGWEDFDTCSPCVPILSFPQLGGSFDVPVL